MFYVSFFAFSSLRRCVKNYFNLLKLLTLILVLTAPTGTKNEGYNYYKSVFIFNTSGRR